MQQQLPQWIAKVKDHVCSTAEWKELQNQILQHVRTHLERNGIAYFSDLNPTEQELIITNAQQVLEAQSQTFCTVWRMWHCCSDTSRCWRKS